MWFELLCFTLWLHPGGVDNPCATPDDVSCYVQAVAAQHQLQYQAAAMQAQAMHAAAANAAWNQSNNPYLSGLCFPYNLYGAAGVQQQQLYAAYARSAALSPLSICLSIADKAVLLKPSTFARSCCI